MLVLDVVLAVVPDTFGKAGVVFFDATLLAELVGDLLAGENKIKVDFIIYYFLRLYFLF